MSDVRERLGAPALPFITFQINRMYTPCGEAVDRQWGMVRQAQRDAMYALPGVYTLPSLDVAMYDFIHNAASGNLVIGERAARCALTELYGRALEWRAPEAVRAVRRGPDRVELLFERVYNWLNCYEQPASLLPFDAEDGEGLVHPTAYEARRDSILLTFAPPARQGRGAARRVARQPRRAGALGLHAPADAGLLRPAHPGRVRAAMQDAFRYCFRFCCDPGFNDETETQSLLRFCSEALVDDVMVFVNVQELNTGHLDEREQAVYLRLLERLGAAARRARRYAVGQPLAFAHARRPWQIAARRAGFYAHGGPGGPRRVAVRVPGERRMAALHRRRLRPLCGAPPGHGLGGG